MQQIDPHEFQQRLDRLADLLGKMVEHAEIQSRMRCPYKNKDSRCTARFGCRYQQPDASHDLPICTSDDSLDYRSAWETGAEAPPAMRSDVRQRTREQGDDSATAGDE